MKIILSRKGVDARNGGVPSPILPDGKAQSLPIPEKSPLVRQGVVYNDLQSGGVSLGQLIHELSNGRLPATTVVHLDPDLHAETCRRLPGWRPLFGQEGAAQGHLAKQGVGVGDLFLFFGWFRQAEQVNGRYRFVRHAPDIHLLFGWLQVGEVWHIGPQARHTPTWAAPHPHLLGRKTVNNTVYVACDHLNLDNRLQPCPGAGAFAQYQPTHKLTADHHTRTFWQLPPWFRPRNGRFPLTYHQLTSRWQPTPDNTYLQTVPIGQEFVLDTADYPEAIAWVLSLLQN